MDDSTYQSEKKKKVRKNSQKYQAGSSDAVYGLGLLGAWVYYIVNASTIWEGLLGIVKGIFWPGFMVYELLELLNK